MVDSVCAKRAFGHLNVSLTNLKGATVSALADAHSDLRRSHRGSWAINGSGVGFAETAPRSVRCRLQRTLQDRGVDWVVADGWAFPGLRRHFLARGWRIRPPTGGA